MYTAIDVARRLAPAIRCLVQGSLLCSAIIPDVTFVDSVKSFVCEIKNCPGCRRHRYQKPTLLEA